MQTGQRHMERARKGKGPSIVENITYRYRGHFEGDPQKYRTTDEIDEYRKTRDPIDRFQKNLKKEGIITPGVEKKIRKEITKLIEGAVQFGQEAPLPRPEDALEGLFVNP